MDIYQAKEFFERQNPGKTVAIEFDNHCQKRIEISMVDGVLNKHHHVEFDKVLVVIDGQASFYFPIASHREVRDWDEMKADLMNKELPEA